MRLCDCIIFHSVSTRSLFSARSRLLITNSIKKHWFVLNPEVLQLTLRQTDEWSCPFLATYSSAFIGHCCCCLSRDYLIRSQGCCCGWLVSGYKLSLFVHGSISGPTISLFTLYALCPPPVTELRLNDDRQRFNLLAAPEPVIRWTRVQLILVCVDYCLEAWLAMSFFRLIEIIRVF